MFFDMWITAPSARFWDVATGDRDCFFMQLLQLSGGTIRIPKEIE